MATGSYEGSLTVEGTSDRHEPSSFTGRWSRRSRRLPHDGASDGASAPKRRTAKAAPASAQEEEATGVSEARSISKHRGKTTPTLESVVAARRRTSSRPPGDASPAPCLERSAEADEGAVKHPFPRYYLMEPKTPWGAHAAKVASAGRELARYGYTQFVRVADVGWMHRASRPPGGRKTSWRAGALAGRKLEASLTRGTGG